VIRIRRGLKILQVAGDAGGAGEVVVVVDVAIETDARRIGVRIGQRKAHACVIKLCPRPTICSVALLTTDRETRGHMVWAGGGLVVRRVAGIALGRKPLKLPCGSALVTSLTFYRRMRADEREAILMVTNRGYGNLPAFDGVAGFTIRAELAAVNVGMAIRTFLPHIRKNEFHMALGALHLFVHAAQRVAGLVVVKFRDASDGLPTQ